MADKKISELVSLAGKDVAATDFFPVVDVSVTETKSLTRDELRNAVNAIQFAATKALATTAAASLPDDTIIEVAADESLSGDRTRYTVTAGALVFAYGVVTKAYLADTSDPAKGAALVGFKQAGASAAATTVQGKLRDSVGIKGIRDFGAVVDGTTDDTNAVNLTVADKNSASSIFTIPPGSIKINGVIDLTGYHHISGFGDASRLLLGAGARLQYSQNTGVFDDHAHRTIKDFRITGDGTFAAHPNPQNGTTTNYQNTVAYKGNYGHVSGMTFELGAVGMKESTSYTHLNQYNYYRANKIGLWLENVTSHTELVPYFRYNSDAAILMTGTMQNVTVSGGAIEGNIGRGIWMKDIHTASVVELNLVDVYMESNGNKTAGIPAVDIQNAANIHVTVTNGSYWQNVLNGITNGVYKWGRSVAFSGSVLGGVHRADIADIGPGVYTSACFNTETSAAASLSAGLSEPTMLTQFKPRVAGATYGFSFQVPVSGRPAKKLVTANLATLSYPHIPSQSAGVVKSEDLTLDYGDGSWTKLQFLATAGDYSNNYAQLEYIADAANGFPYRVVTFLVYAYGDFDLGAVASGASQSFAAFHRLNAGKTYRLMFLTTLATAGDMRLRIFPVSANQPAISVLPVYTAKFSSGQEQILFADRIARGEI